MIDPKIFEEMEEVSRMGARAAWGIAILAALVAAGCTAFIFGA